MLLFFFFYLFLAIFIFYLRKLDHNLMGRVYILYLYTLLLYRLIYIDGDINHEFNRFMRIQNIIMKYLCHLYIYRYYIMHVGN